MLEKVKALFLIPEVNLMSPGMVAKFFDVPVDTVGKVYRRNRNEFDSDGAKSLCSKDFEHLGHDVWDVKKDQSGLMMTLSSGDTYRVAYAKTTYYPPRAIMRMALLLRDSAVAKEVRTRLLDAVEQGKNRAQTAESVEQEQKTLRDLIADIILADSEDQRMRCMTKYHDHMRGKIFLLESEKKQVEDALEVLLEGSRRWGNRPTLNAIIRAAGGAYAKKNGLTWNPAIGYGKMWKELYHRLEYRCGMRLSSRKSGTLLDGVKDKEWPDILRTAAGLAEEQGVIIPDVIGELNRAEKLA